MKPSVTTLGTAGNGGVVCSTLGAGGGDGATELKMEASWCSAAWCSSVIGLRGEAAYGFCNAKIKLWAVAVAASADDVRGRGTREGNQRRVLAIRSLPVSRTHTLKQWFALPTIVALQEMSVGVAKGSAQSLVRRCVMGVPESLCGITKKTTVPGASLLWDLFLSSYVVTISCVALPPKHSGL